MLVVYFLAGKSLDTCFTLKLAYDLAHIWASRLTTNCLFAFFIYYASTLFGVLTKMTWLILLALFPFLVLVFDPVDI